MAKINVVDDDGRVVEVIEYLEGHALLPRVDYSEAFKSFMQDPDEYFRRLEAGEFDLGD